MRNLDKVTSLQLVWGLHLQPDPAALWHHKFPRCPGALGNHTVLTLRLVHLCLSTEFLLLMAAEIIGKCPRWRSPRAASRKHFPGSGSDLSGHVETAERKAGESKGLRWEEVVAGGESARQLLATTCRPLSRSVLRICKVPLALSHARQPVLC